MSGPESRKGAPTRARPPKALRAKSAGSPRWAREAPRAATDPLASLGNDELLDSPLAALPLRLGRSPVASLVGRLHDELAARAIPFSPHAYLSTEWFVGTGTTAIGVPFWLAHPRLLAMERRMMLEVEGGTPAQALRILRHEAGHALDFAYGFHRDPERRRLFGRSSTPYPRRYAADPESRDFVRHLDPWYAQSHPDEDFAETFAVWLAPGSAWRARYRHWPGALAKLRFVDRALRDLGPAPAAGRDLVAPLELATGTLREHYAARLRAILREGAPPMSSRLIGKLFIPAPLTVDERDEAESLLTRERDRLRNALARCTGLRKITAGLVVDALRDRCRGRRLRLRGGRARGTEAILRATAALVRRWLAAGHCSMLS